MAATAMLEAKTLATALTGYKKTNVTWRNVLNNTTSTRPKDCGGPTCKPLRDLLAYHRIVDLQANLAPLISPGSARPNEVAGWLNECPQHWCCAIIALPNSFSKDDQRVLKVAAAAAAQTEAMQKVCLLAFTHLLLRGPTLVLLRPNHWSVHVTDIQQAAATISGIQPTASSSGMPIALAPPPRSRRAYLYYEPPAEGEEQEREEQICEILSDMISQSSSGWVNPSATKGAWRLLRRYVRPRGLAEFIREHKQFQLVQTAGKTWRFSWAQQGLDDPPDTHAPVSDSVCERATFHHQCDHGKWLKRSARPLCAGHALAELDSIAAPPGDIPHCCRPHPREERYDQNIGKWMVWCAETTQFVEEDIFYMGFNV